MEPEYRFCKSADGTEIGYAKIGAGPPIIACTPSPANFEAMWAHRTGRDWFARLGQQFTYIAVDRRGTGLSQREVDDFSLEAELADFDAVAATENLTRFHIFAAVDGCGVALPYAARFPERVGRIALFIPYARYDFRSQEGMDSLRKLMLAEGGWSIARRSIASAVMPTGPADAVQTMVQTMKDSFTPETYAAYNLREASLDVTEMLPLIDAPVLIVHRKDSRLVPTSAARFVASNLKDAQFVLLNGDACTFAVDPEQLLKPILEFLGDAAPTQSVEAERSNALAAVLFTDLVGHTEMMSRLGDERGREVLREHERITREVLAANGGTEVKTMGDGFMASFGSVTKAVQCAAALQRAFAEREGEALSVRVGLNAGEPIEEDGDLFGATVILASRIAAKAEGGEILVSDNVRSLCSGKGILFADRGEFVAKGFEEPVRLFEVNWRGEG